MQQRRLACVVMTFRGREDVVRAVRSLLVQDPEPEVVVVNSGGNSPEQRLREAGLDVRVLDIAQPLTPGGARNVGVAATTAPFVSFLAGDCWAAPGWVAGRLREHEDGARAVAARVLNPYPRNAFACAFHLVAHGRRAAPSNRLLGLSYERAWLERSGKFRDTTVAGEDVDMQCRLGADARVAAPSDVVTFHDHPRDATRLAQELADRARRQTVEARRHGVPPGRRPVPLYAADHLAAAMAATLSGSAQTTVRETLRGLPLALPAAVAYAFLALSPPAAPARQPRAASPTSAASAPQA
ncbi:MAG TPA: glycosyltransferase [Solirubrobacteraceae bacterium]